ncbi:hypothetical protein [uncultured Tateyamaria sp.]|uniref:hypothetical protein n=1 Tax=uncultured Tateyamaria sp. TaxID=455651 RepID=UPI00260AD73C|nr:hypothetical protein [uncultured Tateyamaria sp.]
MDKEYAKIVEDCFGLWSNSLWGLPVSLDKFSDLKEAYFYLIERLLDDGIVRFVHPDEVENIMFVASRPPPIKTIQDTSTHWRADTNYILSFLKSHWPQRATHKDDLELNTYFYEIPPIIWHRHGGEWIGS